MSHKMEGVCCYVPQFNYNSSLEATPISARSHCVNYPITYNYTYTQSPRLSSPPSSPQPTTATSIDCRSLPKTSDLVAKFEKNIQEYRTRRSPRRRKEIAKEEHSGGVQRVESFTLRQRAKVHSPLRNTGNLSSSEEFQSPVRLRSTLVGHQDLCDPVKRSSCGLRIACPSAKPALVGGLKSTTDSAYSCYFSPSLYSSPLNTPESWRVNSSITNHSELLDLSSDFNISPDIRSSKVEPMAPVTVVTTSTSDSYRQNKGIIREISTPMSPISANDSGAETMTSMNSIVASSDSTPTQERFLCSDYAPESGTTTQPSQVYQSTVHRSYKARIPLNVMTERVPHRGEGDIPQIHPGNTNPSTTTSGLRTPLSVIRKTRFSGLKFCGLSKTSWSKSKDKNRDPYIPSPSHTPSTPEVTHYKVFKPKSAASKISGRCSSEDQLDSVPPRQTSEMQRRVGNGRPSVVTSLFDTSSRRGPGKTKMGTSMLNASHQEIKVGHEQEGNSITNKDRSTRRGQSVDSKMGHSERKATDSHQGRTEENANRMLHKKAMSFTSDEELSVGTTTVDDDCELASIPDSVSSRGHRGALNRLLQCLLLRSCLMATDSIYRSGFFLSNCLFFFENKCTSP